MDNITNPEIYFSNLTINPDLQFSNANLYISAKGTEYINGIDVTYEIRVLKIAVILLMICVLYWWYKSQNRRE